MRTLSVLFVLSLTACGSSQPPAAPPAADPIEPTVAPAPVGPPVAEPRPVTDTYHGVAVVDAYQWLESSDDAAVKTWAAGQTAFARAQLDAMPNVEAIRTQLHALWMAPHASYGGWQVRGKRAFAMQSLPPKEQSVLVVFDDLNTLANPRVVLDPTTLSDDITTSFDWVVVSPDGSKVAASISNKGSESGDLAVFETATGARLADAIPRVNYGTALGSLTWLADSTGFYYARYPREGERSDADRGFYSQLWFHRLGTPVEQDKMELGTELTRLAQIQTELRPETGELLASVQNGDSGGIAHWLRSPKGTWTQLSTYEDRIEHVAFGSKGELFGLSFADAPRGKVLRLTGGATDVSKARVIVPEGPDAIDANFYSGSWITVTPKRIYLTYQVGGPISLRAFDHKGKRLADPPQEEVAYISVPRVVRNEELLFYQASYLTPPGWYRFDAATGKTTRIDSVSEHVAIDFSDAVVRREFATSRDGTKVPLTVVMRADHPMDGSRPCVAAGYGGYGLSETPYYSPTTRVYLDRGVCRVFTNLRGGGEYGRAWHEQGMLTLKQNVFDDFAAVLDHLAAKGYTSPERLGIVGGSNGGLLMGAMLTQHPDKMGAVSSAVGIYDALRAELEPNGAFNVPEFGTVKDEAQFRALRAYSPYHAVAKGTRYPAVLLTHGDNDPRVAPWHSRKFAAALQAANASDEPILLLTSSTGGHGPGSLSGAIDLWAYRIAFLMHHIGAVEPE